MKYCYLVPLAVPHRAFDPNKSVNYVLDLSVAGNQLVDARIKTDNSNCVTGHSLLKHKQVTSDSGPAEMQDNQRQRNDVHYGCKAAKGTGFLQHDLARDRRGANSQSD